LERRNRLHPDDRHPLDDWRLYGPKDREIADLVSEIAERGVRLVEIEKAIKAMLVSWLASFPPDPTNGEN
jgi:hypothetical protein